MLKFILALAIVTGNTTAHPPLWLAKAIAYAIEHDGPVAGWTPEYTAAVMVVTSRDEGRWCAKCPVGDRGHSHTTWQIWARSDAQAVELERDPIYAARVALAIMREGAKQCPDAPLAPYCGSCRSKVARAISERRMREAAALIR